MLSTISCLLAIYVFLKNIYSDPLPIFFSLPIFNQFIFLILVIWVLYIFWISTPVFGYQKKIFANIFSHSIAFSFCWWFPSMCKSFWVWCNPICLFCFCCTCLRRHVQVDSVLDFVSLHYAKAELSKLPYYSNYIQTSSRGAICPLDWW